jgi:hypothetical protein
MVFNSSGIGFIHHHTGGLENHERQALRFFEIHHHTGGLGVVVNGRLTTPIFPLIF